MQRLIDANELYMEVLVSYINSAIKIMNPEAYKTANDILDRIEKQPIIDPVKHGHWEDSSNGWTCSNCQKDYSFDRKYCPNCGAKMDEQT